LHICIFSKKAARMNSMHSVRKMFDRTEEDIKRSRDCLSGTSVGKLGCDMMGCMGGTVCGFNSYQLNCVLLLSYFFLIFIFSSAHLLIFPRSSYHISIFHILISSYSHISIFSYSHVFKNAAHMNSLHSVKKMFQVLISWDVMWWDVMWWDGTWRDVWQGSRVRFTSTQLCFVFFLFYFLIFLFSSFIFPHSSYHLSRFHLRIFTYCRKRQRARTICVPSGRCLIEEKGLWSDPGTFERDKCC
jgi:hypothetical protein